MSVVKITKPTEQQLKELNVDSWGIWECDPKIFDWEYTSEESFYVLEGKVKVQVGDETVEFGKGDLVIFPAGCKCVWTVIEAIRKRYTFDEIVVG